MSTALVSIDVQQGMFTFKRPLYRGDDLLRSIAALLGRARASKVPVYHVQHNGGADHILARGSVGWQHHPVAAPKMGEVIIEKQHSSAFHGTGFHARLLNAGIDRLVVVGIQTEYCVDSACRAAHALGYKVILVSNGHSTFDSKVLTADRIIEHHNHTLGDGFAELLATDAVRF